MSWAWVLCYLQEVSRSHRAGVEGFLVPAFAFCLCPPLRNTKEKKWGKARKECIPSKIHTHYHLGPVHQDCLILRSSGPMGYRKPMERQDKYLQRKFISQKNVKIWRVRQKKSSLNLWFCFDFYFFLLKMREDPVFFHLSSFALQLFAHLPYIFRYKVFWKCKVFAVNVYHYLHF